MRVAQNDAHMTSLIALTGGAEPAPTGAVRQVMESIVRFYPRIAWIDLVSLDGAMAPVVEVPQGGGEDLSPLSDAIAAQVRGKIGVHPSGDERYLLAKRAPEPSSRPVPPTSTM